MKNIYLIGMMGSGKTTVARELAKQLELPFIDLDVELEKKAGKSIAEIFNGKGEDAFRDLETEVLTSFSKDGVEAVFATGGGVVIRRENREWMRASGTVVFLEAPLEILWSRVSRQKGRPLLEDFDPKRKMMSILNARQPLYEDCAEIRVQTEDKSPEQIAREIRGKLEFE